VQKRYKLLRRYPQHEALQWNLDGLCFSSAIARRNDFILFFFCSKWQDPHRFAAPLAKAFAFEGPMALAKPGMKNIHSQADQARRVASEVGKQIGSQCLRPRFFHPRNTEAILGVLDEHHVRKNSWSRICETFPPRALISFVLNVLRRPENFLFEIFKLAGLCFRTGFSARPSSAEQGKGPARLAGTDVSHIWEANHLLTLLAEGRRPGQ